MADERKNRDEERLPTADNDTIGSADDEFEAAGSGAAILHRPPEN